MVSLCALSLGLAVLAPERREKSRYDIYCYIIAASADEETYRWLAWRASENTTGEDLKTSASSTRCQAIHTSPSKDKRTIAWGGGGENRRLKTKWFPTSMKIDAITFATETHDMLDATTLLTRRTNVKTESRKESYVCDVIYTFLEIVQGS